MKTIRDVAASAGVAISTVSAVINRSDRVSEQIVTRVNQAIREIGYVPHAGAQSLRRGQSRIIGLVVPDIGNPHFATMARVVERACLAAGYMAVVLGTSQEAERESQVLHMMRAQRVAGLIVVPMRTDAEHGAKLQAELHVPTVLMETSVAGMRNHVIKLDNVEAGYLAADHLLALGHRRIAVVGSREGDEPADDRIYGVRKALAARGLPFDEGLFLKANYEQSLAREATLEVLKRPERPTAILALSNMMTLGVLRGVLESGLSVPGDVSIAGVDDFEWAEFMSPRLTLVAQPVSAMAQRAIEALLELIERETPPAIRTEVFHPSLIIRDSAAPLGSATVQASGPI